MTKRLNPPLFLGREGGGVTGTTGEGFTPAPAVVGTTRCWTVPAGETLVGPVAKLAGEVGGGAARVWRTSARASVSTRLLASFPRREKEGQDDGPEEDKTDPARLLDDVARRTERPLGQRHGERVTCRVQGVGRAKGEGVDVERGGRANGPASRALRIRTRANTHLAVFASIASHPVVSGFFQSSLTIHYMYGIKGTWTKGRRQIAHDDSIFPPKPDQPSYLLVYYSRGVLAFSYRASICPIVRQRPCSPCTFPPLPPPSAAAPCQTLPPPSASRASS